MPPSAQLVARRYAALVGQSTHDGDGLPLRYPSGLLRTQRDYGEGGAMLPRGAADEVGEAKDFLRQLGQKVANTDDPVALMRRVLDLLRGRKIMRLSEEVERLIPRIDKAWNEDEYTWDWKPAARFIRDWLTDNYGEPSDVFMSKSPGEPLTINITMPPTNRRFNDKWDRRKFLTMRKQLAKFGLRALLDEDKYQLDDGKVVVVNLATGDTAGWGGTRLARFSSGSSARIADMNTPSPIDGLRKQKVLSILNRLLDPFTKGLHRDEYWAPIQNIRNALDRENIPYEGVEGTGRYEKENGVDVRKVWKYKVPFVNEKGRPDVVYISITASGAGPASSPLDVYDVVAYAS